MIQRKRIFTCRRNNCGGRRNVYAHASERYCREDGNERDCVEDCENKDWEIKKINTMLHSRKQIQRTYDIK